jgi:hypothetical protein
MLAHRLGRQALAQRVISNGVNAQILTDPGGRFNQFYRDFRKTQKISEI